MSLLNKMNHTFQIVAISSVIVFMLTLPVLHCSNAADNVNHVPETVEKNFVWDTNGYLFFCLCMGRIGNKIDHFLGGLAFAKGINRTLVLPPIRTYRNIPFDNYFQVAPLLDYHRVILAADFLQHLAPTHWPPGKRAGFCYVVGGDGQAPSCEVKAGHPHGPFWDDMNIDFDEIVPYSLYTEPDGWNEMYPASKYPVIAMRGAPARYPIIAKHRPLQKYLVIAEHIQEEAEHLIRTKLPDEQFIGIHLRNGGDWVKSCDHVESSPRGFMSSPQCIDGSVSKEICFPSHNTILKKLEDVIGKTNISTVFVATDKNPMIKEIETYFKAKAPVRVYHLDPHEPMVDQAILIKSAHFIGNCVSSFTAFVARTRTVNNMPTDFWGM